MKLTFVQPSFKKPERKQVNFVLEYRLFEYFIDCKAPKVAR